MLRGNVTITKKSASPITTTTTTTTTLLLITRVVMNETYGRKRERDSWSEANLRQRKAIEKGKKERERKRLLVLCVCVCGGRTDSLAAAAQQQQAERRSYRTASTVCQFAAELACCHPHERVYVRACAISFSSHAFFVSSRSHSGSVRDLYAFRFSPGRFSILFLT